MSSQKSDHSTVRSPFYLMNIHIWSSSWEVLVLSHCTHLGRRAMTTLMSTAPHAIRPVPILMRTPCGGHVFLTLVWVLIPLLSHRQSYLHITFLELHSYNCLNSPISPTSPPHYSSVPLLYRCHHPQLFTTSSASITLAYSFSVSSVHSSVPTGSLTWAMSKSPPSKQRLDSALG